MLAVSALMEDSLMSAPIVMSDNMALAICMIVAQDALEIEPIRRQALLIVQRRTCDGGYYSSSTSCLPFEGSCTNGDLITQSSRTVANHCGTCATGYHISGTSCQVNCSLKFSILENVASC